MSNALYETFCDRSYYDLWCVRKVGETRWGYCYHMNNKEEAEGLVKQLTDLERELAEARKEQSAPMETEARAWMDVADKLAIALVLRHREQPYPEPQYMREAVDDYYCLISQTSIERKSAAIPNSTKTR